MLLHVVGALGLSGILWQWRRAEHLVRVERADRERIKVFDVATAQEVAVLAGHKQSITDIAFWPDGSAIVSVSRDTVHVWRAPSLSEIMEKDQEQGRPR